MEDIWSTIPIIILWVNIYQSQLPLSVKFLAIFFFYDRSLTIMALVSWKSDADPKYGIEWWALLKLKNSLFKIWHEQSLSTLCDQGSDILYFILGMLILYSGQRLLKTLWVTCKCLKTVNICLWSAKFGKLKLYGLFSKCDH